MSKDLKSLIKTQVTISIIPETISKTNLSFLKKGDFVNVEADQQTISIVETVKKLT